MFCCHLQVFLLFFMYDCAENLSAYKMFAYCSKNYFSQRFDRRDEAQEAINSLNGVIPENGTEPLVVKIAEEHGKQKAAYYAGWQAGYNQSRGKYPTASSFDFLYALLFQAFMSYCECAMLRFFHHHQLLYVVAEYVGFMHRC